MSGQKKILYCSTGQIGNVLPFVEVTRKLKEENISVDFFVYPNLNVLLEKYALKNLNTATLPLDEINGLISKVVGSNDEKKQNDSLLHYHKLAFSQRLDLLNRIIPRYDLIVIGDRENAAILSLHQNKKKYLVLSFNPFRRLFDKPSSYRFIYNQPILKIALALFDKGILKFLPGINHLYEADKTLIGVCDFLAETDKNKVIGYLPNPGIRGAGQQNNLQSFIEQHKDKKHVLIAFGSYINFMSKDLLNSVVSCVIEKGYTAILVSQNYTFPDSNFFALKQFSDLDEILPLCHFVIHHAGHGSVVTSILNEKPSVNIPLFGVQEKTALKLAKIGLSPPPVGKYQSDKSKFAETIDQLTRNYNSYLDAVLKAKKQLLKENGMQKLKERIVKELNGN